MAPRRISPRQQIAEFVASFTPADLVLSFDVDFDIPLDHRLAIGVLRMSQAFEFSDDRSVESLVIRTGAYWCDIVRADVEYVLLDALRLIEESRDDAEKLFKLYRDNRLPADDVAARYVVARWFDGAGKVRYRLGNYALARMSFERAAEVARTENLWWCLPDLESNLARARFEENKQAFAGADRVQSRLPKSMADLQGDLSTELTEFRHRFQEMAGALGIDFDHLRDLPDRRQKEFLRGYSSILHNLSITLRDREIIDESFQVSREALGISRALGDEYRLAQALSHQATLSPDNARTLYDEVLKLRWPRGRRIARQNLARLNGQRGVSEIQRLLSEITEDTSSVGRRAGMDIDLYAYAVRIYRGLAGYARMEEKKELEEDISRRELAMARQVRRVVAIPAYKRAYAASIRPAYLHRTAQDLRSHERPAEAVLALIEESSAREILDMMAASSISQLEPPPPLDPDLMRDLHKLFSGENEGDPSPGRRGGLRSTPTDERMVQVLAERESHFENQFLREPLEPAPDDPEIAHQVKLFAANHPDTCVIRYFLYGDADATSPSLGAFVIRGTSFVHIDDFSYPEVCDLERSLSANSGAPPSQEDSQRIWSLLVEPVWRFIVNGGMPHHLVLVPVDAIFNIPLHVASRPGEGVPLAALIPLSHSVSMTALVARGRHLLKRQPVSADDDLAAIVVMDEEGPVSGNELVYTGWPEERITIAGTVPQGLGGAVIARHDADWEGVAAIADVKPEFFVYIGHGCYEQRFQDLGAFLLLQNDVLTQYDFALRIRLPRNKLAILSACVAGQGAITGGGEVSGFLRALMAAGTGAIGVTLWRVLDESVVDTVRFLLRRSRSAAKSSTDQTFDVVEELHSHYKAVIESEQDFSRRVERLPVVLYL